MRAFSFLFIIEIILLILSGCKGNYHRSIDIEGYTITSEATLLTLIDCGEWTAVEIRVPWMDSVPLERYAIINPESKDVSVPDGFVKIQAPLNRSIVFSSVYTSAINELEKLSSVKGVADGSFYLSDDTISSLISRGIIKDIGSGMAPLIEEIVDIEPDAILLSPYSGGVDTGLERMKIPLVWMADYLETTPLGRAEWLLFIGELYGERELASEIYRQTVQNYRNIKELVSSANKFPSVITEKPMSGIWYVPGGESYIAKMLEDAGACYPWEESLEAGSIPLDEAAVIDRGMNSDYWLIKDIRDISAASLLKEIPRANIFQAFPENVFYCNTLTSPYYNMIAFHPDRILSDMAKIFHPEVFIDNSLEFYKHI